MNHQIKLIGLDLDGTLLNSQKEISQETINTIQSALDQGILVVPVTGRPRNGLPKKFLEMSGVRFAITSNGASTYDLTNNQLIIQNHISADGCIEIINRVARYDVIVELFHDGLVYVEPLMLDRLFNRFRNHPILSYMKTTRLPVDNLVEFVLQGQKTIEGMSIMAESEAEKLSIATTLADIETITLLHPSPGDIELNHSLADKGTALLQLGAQLGIPKESIMACGDSYNDYGLISLAGVGVAMGNADSRLKELATFVTKTNDEDGVAYAIKKYALS